MDRYLIREFTGPFFLAIGGFSIIAVFHILMYLVELTVSRGVPIHTTLRILIYEMPELMIQFFPMAVLFAVMLMMVRMAKDNELTVLRTTGIPTLRIITPILLLCILASILTYYINDRVVPWTNRVSDELIRREITRKPPPDIVENVVFKVPPNRYFYIEQIDKKTQHMRNLLIFEEGRYYPRITTAEEAIWQNSTWTLFNGKITEMTQEGSIQFIDEFSEMVINVDQAIRTFYKRHKSAKEMNSNELEDRIQTLEQGGVSTRILRVEYHMKKSLPVACFIFGLVGIAFCLTFVKSSKDWWGVIIAICSAVLIVGLYLFLVSVFKAYAKDGAISPFLGAWIPNMVYGSIGLIVITYQTLKR